MKVEEENEQRGRSAQISDLRSGTVRHRPAIDNGDLLVLVREGWRELEVAVRVVEADNVKQVKDGQLHHLGAEVHGHVAFETCDKVSGREGDEEEKKFQAHP
jgi:hypothetical protein